MTWMNRLLLARRVLRDLRDRTTAAKLACIGAVIVVLCGAVAAAINSQTAFIALVFTAGLCAYLVWSIAPAMLNLDAMIVQLVRLEIGGHGLTIDFEKPAGRAFLSGAVTVENATGCAIKLRSYRFEQVAIDLPGAAPMVLQTPESTCQETVPHGESRRIPLEKNEIFGGREGLGDAACVPMKMLVCVHFEIEGENVTTAVSRALQCYALVKPLPTDPLLLP